MNLTVAGWLHVGRVALAASAFLCGLGQLARATPAEPESSLFPTAKTTAGVIRGYGDHGIAVFKGVPYGADTSQRRFRAPVPPEPWAGIRDTRDFGPAAPQPSGPAERRESENIVESEDCLRLNLWTPGLRDGKHRPVLVYFHGGAYNAGSVNEPVYDGVRLARRGNVVIVTVNHRLNGFGFLYLAELGGNEFAESGNAGMLDLVLALRWVRENIEEFGGAPGNITIFGQSGGGAKCATLMAMPLAHGLFHRVWTMSGQQITGRTRAHATATAREVLARLGLSTERIRELDAVPMGKLKSAMRGAVWAPVVDGDVLPRDPFEPTASPLSRDVPMVMGNTHDETTNLIGRGDPATFSLSWETLPGKINEHVHPFIGDLRPEEIVAKYQQLYPSYSATEVFFAATTAARSWKSMILQADRRAQQNGAPLYVYYLYWRSSVDGGKWKAPHTLDIPLVFDNVRTIALRPDLKRIRKSSRIS